MKEGTGWEASLYISNRAGESPDDKRPSNFLLRHQAQPAHKDLGRPLTHARTALNLTSADHGALIFSRWHSTRTGAAGQPSAGSRSWYGSSQILAAVGVAALAGALFFVY